MATDLKDLERQLLENPFDPRLRLTYADALGDAAQWNEALRQYELLAGQAGTDARPWVGASRALLALDRPAEALDRYRQAREREGFTPDPRLEEISAGARPSGPAELRVLSGGAGAGGAKVLPFARSGEPTRFTDIVGMEGLKKTLRLQIVEPFLRPGIFARFRKKAGGGVLLYGPPGCGKTMMAKAVASECQADFIAVGISDILNMWIGESERNLSLLFEKARSQKPAVLFFDELDALAFSRSKARSEHSRTVVNEFLSQLDGIDGANDQVLVMAATNMPWDVDPAMKRPGRFDRQIFVSPPDEAARAEMFRTKLTGVPCDPVDFDALARESRFYSGADVDGVIDLAKEFVLTEIIDGKPERNISQADLAAACERFHPSTLDWLKTARNLVKYAGSDEAYRDVEAYLKANKLF